jgi:hypothetical protein
MMNFDDPFQFRDMGPGLCFTVQGAQSGEHSVSYLGRDFEDGFGVIRIRVIKTF